MHAQKGNALFLILIAVALFAALSYAITSSSRGQGNVDAEQAAMEASYLFSFAARMELAMQRITIVNGCNVSAIDSVVMQGSPATNPGPCNLYDKIDGGGADWFELRNASDSVYGTYGHAPQDNKRVSIQNVQDLSGTRTTESDVILRVFGIKEETCKAINKQAKIVTGDGELPLEDTPWEGGWLNPKPTTLAAGNPTITVGIRSGFGPIGITGQRVGCYRATRPGFPMGWHFYSVLIEH